MGKIGSHAMARDYLAAAGASKHIYAAGSTDGKRAFVTVERFHMDLARWYELQSMPMAQGGLRGPQCLTSCSVRWSEKTRLSPCVDTHRSSRGWLRHSVVRFRAYRMLVLW